MENNSEKNKKVNQIKVVRHKWPDEVAEEKRKHRQKVFLILTIIGTFIVGGLFGGIVASNFINEHQSKMQINLTPRKKEVGKAEQIYRLLNNNWYYQKDSDEIIDNAIKGMTYDKRDSHTDYLSSKETKMMIGSLNGGLVGVGIQFMKNGDHYLIDGVMAGSPAEKAGIKSGDILVSVDGIDVSSKTKEEVSDMVRGEKGESVILTVDRNGVNKKFKIKRDDIDTSVYGYIKSKVGVLDVKTFGQDTTKSVENNLKRFKKDGINNLVIDLRDNGGGYVDTAISMAGLFVGKETILYEKNRNGDIEAINSDSNKVFHFNKVAILVNNNTASAAEILTLALKEYLPDCTIIGTQTYGKGTVQHTEQFNDGSMLKYTVAEWLSPNKESINGVGIKPDNYVELPEAINHEISRDQNEYEYDQVGDGVKDVQIYLKFLGYNVDREDGYCSKDTIKAIEKFQKDHNLTVDGVVSPKLIKDVSIASAQKWYQNKESLDNQLNEAINYLKED